MGDLLIVIWTVICHPDGPSSSLDSLRWIVFVGSAFDEYVVVESFVVESIVVGPGVFGPHSRHPM